MKLSLSLLLVKHAEGRKFGKSCGGIALLMFARVKSATAIHWRAVAGVNISSSKRWEEFRTFDNVLPVVFTAIISALMHHVPLYLPNHDCGSVQRNVSTTENDRFYVGTIIHD